MDFSSYFGIGPTFVVVVVVVVVVLAASWQQRIPGDVAENPGIQTGEGRIASYTRRRLLNRRAMVWPT